MPKNNLYIFVVAASLLCATLSFAAEPQSALDSQPSVDTVANDKPQAPATDSTDSKNLDTTIHPESQTQVSYVYDLRKLIEKSRQNIKQVNEKIKEQSVIKRNQKREEKAREYYEKGMELTDQGKLDEAREYFEKAIRITEHPEMAGYIKESQRRLKRQEDALKREDKERTKQMAQDEHSRLQDAETGYVEAVSLYRQKKFKEAKDQFQHVEEIVPDYKATRSYLKIVDQDILVQDEVTEKKQKVEIERQQKEAEVAREKEKELWRKEIEQKEKERKAQIQKQADDNYNQALSLYKDKKYKEAKEKFQEVELVTSGYKQTRKYLDRIDNDIEKQAKEMAAAEQKELEHQRWLEEVEKKKQEALRLKDLEVKEREHKKQLEEQAGFLYQAALGLYDKKQYDEALEKFNDIEKTYPGYKSTRIYLTKLNTIKFEQEKRKKAQELKEKPAQTQTQEAKPQSPSESSENKSEQSASSQTSSEQQTPQEPPNPKELKALFDAAMVDFKKKDYSSARILLTKIQERDPNYKNVDRYLAKIDEKIGKAQADQTATPEGEPQKDVSVKIVQPPPPQTTEEQTKEAQDIAELARQSAILYKQISDIADDKPTNLVKKKLGQIDHIMSNLRDEKERGLQKVRQEQIHYRQEQIKSQEQERRDEAERDYNQALEYLRNKDYDNAKKTFLNIQNIYPGYKSTQEYLIRLEDDKKQAEEQAAIEQQHQKVEEEKSRALAAQAAEEERLRELEGQQQAQVKQLAEQASGLNDEILALAKERNINGMKERFGKLQEVLTQLKDVKEAIAARREQQERARQQAKELEEQRKQEEKNMIEQMRKARLEARRQERKPAKVREQEDVKMYKAKEEGRQRSLLYAQAVDLYNQGQYTEAKVLFQDLADKGDWRSNGWIKKIDRIIADAALREKKKSIDERDNFLKERLKIQRREAILDEKAREHELKLSKALERQRRSLDEQSFRERRKEEALKLQERERSRIEHKRKVEEARQRKESEQYQFRKLPAPKLKEEAVNPVKDQMEYSKKRKLFFQEQYKQQQKLKEEEAAKAAQAQAAQAQAQATPAPAAQPVTNAAEHKENVKSDAQKARELEAQRKEELKAQKAKQEQDRREQERKAKEEAKAQIQKRKDEERKQKELEQKRRQEEREQREREIQEKKEKAQKRLEEIKRQKEEEKAKQEERRRQDQERLEKIQQERLKAQQEKEKQLELERKQKEAQQKADALEAQRKADLERVVKEREDKLNAERMAIRKQLEDGVEAMYQEALKLYKNQQYSLAVDKFQDIQDVLPNYKKTNELMDKARELASRQNSSTDTPAKPMAVQTSTSSSSRASAIEKTLDLFDPKSK